MVVTERPPAVAGRFYPSAPGRLDVEVSDYLTAPAPHEPAPARGLRALIVPHAGYVFSGPTAGVAYRLLPPVAETFRTVVLLGPAHYVPVVGIALSSAERWRTPLGTVALAPNDALLQWNDARLRIAVDDIAHTPEHSLEVQVPFLQRVVPGAAILPALVGRSEPDAVADALESWWADPGTLLVVSTDLSHYETDEVAKRLDARTAGAICRADAAAIGDHDACGARPLRAVLQLAARNGARVRELDLRTSADTAGDPWRVVGYGAFAVEV